MISRSSLPVALALAFLVTSPASATVIGVLKITSGAQGVIVGAMSIDWEPAAGGSGTMLSSSGTTITYNNPVVALPTATPGTILDLVGQPFPILNFMTFAGHPDLVFDLGIIGPGDANVNCAGAVNNGDSCSVFAGSPFILTKNANGTGVALTAFGSARDNTAGMANFTGAFTTQINGLTPAQIQANFLGNPNYTLQSTYSAEFTLTAIPEPGSALLIGFGLVAAGLVRRRR